MLKLTESPDRFFAGGGLNAGIGLQAKIGYSWQANAVYHYRMLRDGSEESVMRFQNRPRKFPHKKRRQTIKYKLWASKKRERPENKGKGALNLNDEISLCVAFRLHGGPLKNKSMDTFWRVHVNVNVQRFKLAIKIDVKSKSLLRDFQGNCEMMDKNTMYKHCFWSD